MEHLDDADSFIGAGNTLVYLEVGIYHAIYGLVIQCHTGRGQHSVDAGHADYRFPEECNLNFRAVADPAKGAVIGISTPTRPYIAR